MDHYQDVVIRPDPEFSAPLLMNALFAKLHRALVALESTNIGVSFPGFDDAVPSLGGRLRLHGSRAGLDALHGHDWVTGMRDHLEVREIMAIPPKVQYRAVKRIQVKSSAERLRRRYRSRHEGVTERDAFALIPNSVESRVRLPYLQLKSESTGQRFRLFIEHQPVRSAAVLGEFNAYGLSPNATVPWF